MAKNTNLELPVQLIHPLPHRQRTDQQNRQHANAQSKPSHVFSSFGM